MRDWSFVLNEPVIPGDGPDAALRLALLCWPTFRAVGDLVLLPWVADDAELRARVDTAVEAGSAVREIEEQFNVLEVSNLFSRGGHDDEMLEQAFSDLVGQMWRARLAIQFPERSVEVVVSEWFTAGEWCVVARQSG